MLRTLAEHAGESEATVVRQLIKAAFKARDVEKKRALQGGGLFALPVTLARLHLSGYESRPTLTSLR